MKHRTLILLLCIAFGACHRSLAAANEPPSKSDLELVAFLRPYGDKLVLDLRITNLTSTPHTVLTKQIPTSSTSTNGIRSPYIGLRYMLFGGSAPGLRTWKIIPSLPDLGPVTLLKDETATVAIPLEPELAAVLKDPDAIFSIDYEIREDIATRFGLWHGKLSLKKSVASLLDK